MLELNEPPYQRESPSIFGPCKESHLRLHRCTSELRAGQSISNINLLTQSNQTMFNATHIQIASRPLGDAAVLLAVFAYNWVIKIQNSNFYLTAIILL